MDIRQLQYFTLSAEKHSLSEAAAALYTSQPHVSMVIHSLEQELGVTLFNRTARGVSLTDEGKQIYGYAINILKNAGMMSAISEMHGKNVMSVITTPSSNMAALFTRFYNEHRSENIHYNFLEGGVEEVISKVSDKSASLGFAFIAENKQAAFSYTLEKHRLEFHPLLLTDMVLYVGRCNPLFERDAVDAHELSKLKFIQLVDDYFSINDIIASGSKNKQPLPECVVATNSDHAMIQLLRSTDLCNMCSYWLRDKYKLYDFKMIPIRGYEGKIHFGYISVKNEPLDSTSDEFLRFVSEAIIRDKT